MLLDAGRPVNVKRVERIWRFEVPHKQPKTGRLWPSDGSCIRLRPETGRGMTRVQQRFRAVCNGPIGGLADRGMTGIATGRS
ncbi:hypothetical protein B5V46_08525 [Rhodovulum sp. MB263]|nr:hypothetical protein B5V46_08525 [Rhodovulum sp. MB263]